MSKLNIFKEEWIDMVFEGRNKAYGAYELRAHDSKTTTRALIIGAVFFATVIAAPVIKAASAAAYCTCARKRIVKFGWAVALVVPARLPAGVMRMPRTLGSKLPTGT